MNERTPLCIPVLIALGLAGLSACVEAASFEDEADTPAAEPEAAEDSAEPLGGEGDTGSEPDSSVEPEPTPSEPDASPEPEGAEPEISEPDAGPPDVAEPEPEPEGCVGDCTEKSCGDDGCGGSCGSCGLGTFCDEPEGAPWLCVAQICQPGFPYCAEDQVETCNSAGSGPVTGFTEDCTLAGDQWTCVDEDEAECACVPACEGKACGPDGCEGSCGTCEEDEYCDESSGQCSDQLCTPGADTCDSDGLLQVCNPVGDAYVDGATIDCGDLGPQMVCEGGECVCAPACDGKSCGPDGCGSQCGDCASGKVCAQDSGQCEVPVCAPDQWFCEGGTKVQCNAWGTGSVDAGFDCESLQMGCDQGQCVNVCEPQCQFKECGPDNCGSQCGFCTVPGTTCNNATGQCVQAAGCPCPGDQLCQASYCISCADFCAQPGTPCDQQHFGEQGNACFCPCGGPGPDPNCEGVGPAPECTGISCGHLENGCGDVNFCNQPCAFGTCSDEQPGFLVGVPEGVGDLAAMITTCDSGSCKPAILAFDPDLLFATTDELAGIEPEVGWDLHLEGMTVSPSGPIYLAGWTQQPGDDVRYGWAARLNDKGVVAWSWTYDHPSAFMDVVLPGGQSSGPLLVGFEEGSMSDPTSRMAVAVRLDESTKTPKWMVNPWTYDGQEDAFHAAVVRPDGQAVLVGGHYFDGNSSVDAGFVIVASDGGLSDQVDFGTANGDDRWTSVILDPQDPESSLWVGGWVGKGPNQTAGLLRRYTDASGSWQQANEIALDPKNLGSKLFGVCALPDGTIGAVGEINVSAVDTSPFATAYQVTGSASGTVVFQVEQDAAPAFPNLKQRYVDCTGHTDLGGKEYMVALGSIAQPGSSTDYDVLVQRIPLGFGGATKIECGGGSAP